MRAWGRLCDRPLPPLPSVDQHPSGTRRPNAGHGRRLPRTGGRGFVVQVESDGDHGRDQRLCQSKGRLQRQ